MFDASIPRKNFWSDSVPNKLRCPRCRVKLETHYASYLVAVRLGSEGENFETFAMGGPDLGRFCPQCPVVVLDRDQFGSQLAGMFQSRAQDGPAEFGFLVAGIVNLAAIPEDKRDLPIGGDDNPLPLVEFIDAIEPMGAAAPGGKRLSGNQRRRLRKMQGA